MNKIRTNQIVSILGESYSCVVSVDNLLILKKTKKEESIPNMDFDILKKCSLEDLIQFKEEQEKAKIFVSKGAIAYIASMYLGYSNKRIEEILNNHGIKFRRERVASETYETLNNENKKVKIKNIFYDFYNWKKQQLWKDT